MKKEEIKKEIERRGVNQKEFAELIGVTGPTVTLWLNGKRQMSRQSKMLIKLSNEQLKKIQMEV